MKHLPILLLLCQFGVHAANAEERSLDGTANNLDNPYWGSVGNPFDFFTPKDQRFQRFDRLVYSAIHSSDNAYADGLSAPARSGPDAPLARAVSNRLCVQPPFETPNARGLNAFFNAWAFYLHVDFVNSVSHNVVENRVGLGQFFPLEPFPIFIPPNDPASSIVPAFPFFRGLHDSGELLGNPRQQLNITSAWIDGANVYGTNLFLNTAVRSFDSGKLRSVTLPNGETLPPPAGAVKAEFFDPNDPQNPFNQLMQANLAFYDDTEPIFGSSGGSFSGFEPIFLLFHREHNRVCDLIAGLSKGQLKTLGIPTSQSDSAGFDEGVFQLARKIVIAELQAITYQEFLPAAGVDLAGYAGYDSSLKPFVFNEFSGAASRMGHTLTLPDLPQADVSGSEIGSIDALKNRDNNAQFYTLGLDSSLRGMAQQQISEFDLQVIDGLRNILNNPSLFVGDLIAGHIQRGRGRGLHDFNSMRQALALPAYDNIEEISSDPDVTAGLLDLYADVNSIDPWVGLHAEDQSPDSLFGPTMVQLWGLQFEILRDSDRFFYQNLLDKKSAQYDSQLNRAITFLKNKGLGFDIDNNQGRGKKPTLSRNLAGLILDNADSSAFDRNDGLFFVP